MPTYIIPLRSKLGHTIDAHIEANSPGEAQDLAMSVGQNFGGTNDARLAPLPSCFTPIDGPLLRRQRALLLDMVEKKAGWLTDEQQELIDGLVNLTDAIADYLHDEHGIDCLLSSQAADAEAFDHGQRLYQKHKRD